MSNEERNQLARRVRNNAISNYSWYHKDKNQQVISGAAVAYHELYASMTNKKPLTLENMRAPIQAPIVPYPARSSTSVEKIVKVVKWCFNGFSRLTFKIYQMASLPFGYIKRLIVK